MILEFVPEFVYSLIPILAAVIPAAYLMYYIYRLDRIEKEPRPLLAKLFLMGVLAAVPAIALELLADSWIIPSLPIKNGDVYLITTAIAVGLIEEICKFFFLYRVTWNDLHFNYRYDAVVYAVFVSLGFAAIENIFYVAEFGLSVALMRAFLAIPGHMAFAVFMGSFYGRAKICQVRGDTTGTTTNLLFSYFSAVALHAFYDATAMVGTNAALILFIIFVGIMYVVVYRKIKHESATDESVY